MWKPRYGNCLIWAIYQRVLYGGTLCVVKSFWRPLGCLYFPHVRWIDNTGKHWSYSPTTRARRGKALNLPILFKGCPINVTRFVKSGTEHP